MKRRSFVGSMAAAAAATGLVPPRLAAAGDTPAGARGAHRFAFAFIGDLPYTGLEERMLVRILEEIDPGVSFVVHVGDIKSSSEPCSDELLSRRLALLEQSRLPLLFTPGDNEWTDCWRPRAGGFDPLERLRWLRARVHARAQTMGRQTLPLVRQSGPDGLPENTRLIHGSVLFATLNVPGSNNATQTVRAEKLAAEWNAARERANAAWVDELIEVAARERCPAIVLASHANPDFFSDDPYSIHHAVNRVFSDGYAAHRNLLRHLHEAYPGEILYLHGDTHRQRIDQPLLDADARPLPRFTRVECYGSPFTSSWLRIVVDPSQRPIFEINSRSVAADLPPG